MNALLLLSSRATARIFSFGGGTQSVAVLVLQATGQLARPYEQFIFANVGADSENPDTLDYLEDYAKPYALAHVITLVEVQKLYKGKPDTLLQRVYRDKRSVSLPVRIGGSDGPPGNRTCTVDHKLRVVDKYLHDQGLTQAVIGIGFSLDEWQRARDTDWHPTQSYPGLFTRREHPLLDMRLTRSACIQIITDAGLPIPPKSACFFCPFKRSAEWIELKRESPDLYWKAVGVEQRMNEVRANIGRDRVFLHRSGVPLDRAVGDQLPLFADDEEPLDCTAGVCMT